jgi:hypothetical protein
MSEGNVLNVQTSDGNMILSKNSLDGSLSVLDGDFLIFLRESGGFLTIEGSSVTRSVATGGREPEVAGTGIEDDSEFLRRGSDVDCAEEFGVVGICEGFDVGLGVFIFVSFLNGDIVDGLSDDEDD